MCWQILYQRRDTRNMKQVTHIHFKLFCFFYISCNKKKKIVQCCYKKKKYCQFGYWKKKRNLLRLLWSFPFFLFPRFIRYQTCYVCKHLQNHQKFQIQQNTNYNTITDIIKQSVWEQFAHKSSPKCSKTAADVFMLHAAHFRWALTAP